MTFEEKADELNALIERACLELETRYRGLKATIRLVGVAAPELTTATFSRGTITISNDALHQAYTNVPLQYRVLLAGRLLDLESALETAARDRDASIDGALEAARAAVQRLEEKNDLEKPQ